MAELLIHDLDPKDAGDYTCVVGNQKTTAALSVNGKKSETTRETPECLCPPLPSSFLCIPSHLPLCPASAFFFFNPFTLLWCHVTAFPTLHPPSAFIAPDAVCVVLRCLPAFPQAKGDDMSLN